MRKSVLYLLLALTSLCVRASERDYGMFIHFGPNTFLDIEWGDGQAPVSVYNPAHLDPGQWVRVARDAGFRYVLLVTKHHDGFCLWDSKYTDYDVASSPVKTDVVKAVSDACKKYGLKFAVYYSLWDRHEPSYQAKNFNHYIKYMENQLTELLTQYGEVCELWFDGGWDKPVKDWQLPRIYKLVKKLQPNCAVGVNHTVSAVDDQPSYTWDDLVLPDSCKRDNQYYLRFYPSDFRLWDPKIAPLYDAKKYLHHGKSISLPFEHTICLSKSWAWFQKSKPMPVRDLDELGELFYWTTSNGNSLVMDVAPGLEGTIRPHEADQVIALAHRLGIRQGEPLPSHPISDILSYGAKAEATSIYDDSGTYDARKAIDGGMQTRWASQSAPAQLTVDMEKEVTFSKIVIFEYQDSKQGADGFSNVRTGRITDYTIDIYHDGKWETIYVGDEPMGDCKTIRFPHSYQASKVRLNIRGASAAPSIWEFEVLK